MSKLGFKSSNHYRWSFFRAGGFDQVKLRNGEDIKHLADLDPKLWAALSCPTRGLHFDSRTLDLIDTDKDGRIRVPEIIAAAQWVCGLLKDPDSLLEGSPTLRLDAINDSTDEGKRILASAKQVLTNLGKEGATEIDVEDTLDNVRIFAKTRFNGDGIIPADSSDDAAVNLVIADCIIACGSILDRSGKPGIDSPRVAAFFADLQAYSAWWKLAEDNPAAIWPMGEGTAAAFAAFDTLSGKLDDYFARTRLAGYDARAQAALNRHETEYLSIAAKDMAITADEVRGFPLARIIANQPLALDGPLNPAWILPMSRFVDAVVLPILGARASLTEADHLAIRERFAGYAAWKAKKPVTAVEPLRLARIRAILSSGAKDAIDELIARDKSLEVESGSIASVDKLLRYHRDLYRLLINFVSFRDFYDQDENMAIFQAGTLYLDQRSCDFCVRVDDIARHGVLAPLSRVYLAYCECVRKGGAEKMTIVAAFTAGDADNLMVGRNGVFYDRKNQDWDATIIKVAENPISIRQAFLSPYKRVMRWIEDQIAKRAAAADIAATTSLTGAADSAMGTPAAGPLKPKPKIDIGTVAALGVAVGAITTAMGLVLQAFLGLGMLMPLGIVAFILLISGPSMVIAWLKLRQRNLGPILDANGWAVNTRAKINIPFGVRLTNVAKLPPGSYRDLRDPYAESKQSRNWTIVVLLLLTFTWALWYFGALERLAPDSGMPKSGWVLRQEAKAALAKAAQAKLPATQPTSQPAASAIIIKVE